MLRVWVPRILLVASIILAAGFVAGTAAREGSFPSADIWTTHRPGWLTLFMVVGAISAAGAVPIELAWALIKLREQRTQQLLTNFARLMFLEFTEHSPVLCLTLAVHVWRLSSWPRIREQVLERVVTFKLASGDPSSVRWVRGKGVIGQSWETGEQVMADLRPLQAAYAEGRTTFDRLSAQERNGLSFDEYTQVRGYTAIYARPLFAAKRRVVGCLSVDCTNPDAYAMLAAKYVERSVAETAKLMADALQ